MEEISLRIRIVTCVLVNVQIEHRNSISNKRLRYRSVNDKSFKGKTQLKFKPILIVLKFQY